MIALTPSQLLDFIACYKPTMIYPIPTSRKQQGHTCKIVAIANVLDHHYKTVPPTYGSQDTTRPSLRRIAKQRADSSVGELYNESMFKKLLRGIEDHHQIPENDIEFHRFTADEQHQYIDFIVSEIDKGESPPIIFFELDQQGAFPSSTGDGTREHAAIVIGYLINQETGKLELIFAHSGLYFISEANLIAESSKILQPIRNSETYFQIRNHDQYYLNKKWVQINTSEDIQKMDDYFQHINALSLFSYKNCAQMKPGQTVKLNNDDLIITKLMGNLNSDNEHGFNLTVLTIKPQGKSNKFTSGKKYHNPL